MLKALELVGFKSFADKTRFEFPPGITTIVGPNGSGKSNVVDAIKWVLGEQSVKSLRGKEMADVIFNGADGRPPLNCAEATLTFDNSNGLLPIDTPEVHITRRVYRSGEGEYLINRQPSRLRDIRDLFTGTGAATEAYSVIEQGKVDVLLQASPKDRRAIFEEAAGISRFKAKKIEALRRLERVDQNLLRLADIVDEVDNRLRGVRKQAAKAKRYKQYTESLQALRTQVGLTDWRRLGDELAEIQQRIDSLQQQRRDALTSIERLEQDTERLEQQIARQSEVLHAAETQAAENQALIASRESAIAHERRRVVDLEQEMLRHRRQLAGMNVRVGDLEQQLAQTREKFQRAEVEHRKTLARVESCERDVAEAQQRLETLRGESQRRRTVYMEQMQASSALSNRITALETQLAALEALRQQGKQRLASLDEELAILADDIARLERHEQRLLDERQRHDRDVALQRQRLQELAKDRERIDRQVDAIRQQHTRATERATLLSELEARHEGISDAVRQLLEEARWAGEGPLSGVRGLVAEQFEVPLPYATAIEESLGELAGFVVVERARDLLAYYEQNGSGLDGRVGIVGLDYEAPPSLLDEIDLSGQPGVVGRASQLVAPVAGAETLAQRLLGRTWIVETLPHAAALAESLGRGLQFVTLNGEKLRHDGTWVVGSQATSSGLITRRSELAALDERIASLTQQMEQLEQAARQIDEAISQTEHDVERLSVQRQQVGDELRELRGEIKAKTARRSQLKEQRTTFDEEYRSADQRYEAEAEALNQARQHREQTERRLAELEADLAAMNQQIEQFEDRLGQATQAATEAKVRLAKSEERLDSLRGQLARCEQDQRERQRAIEEHRQRTLECSQRVRQATWNILNAESETAELYLRKERLAAETVRLTRLREEMVATRGRLVREVQAARGRLSEVEKKIHAQELSASEIRLQRDSLAARLRDDYGIELAELEHEPTAEEQQQREEVEQQIAELRRKINNIGNVNLDALDELEDLEQRYERLSAQYADLTDAKASLEQIIQRINADSRRLFAETLEVVREHFQSLFRKLFGGGQADIVLEENVDILESGIEIVARPPGKEPRSISLLSGGEKTLTCVALLLAIFRSRPSPFCVLDEVDAALDEANIERFIGVLQEFLAWTQFIIVTHSKKTMTCASTIYGVTMQESGISKRVSVQFDDATQGHGRPEEQAQQTIESADTSGDRGEKSSATTDDSQAA